MLRVLALAATAVCLQIQSSGAADIAHGQQLALRWCASCHSMDAENARTTTDVPQPFVDVARRSDFDVNRLALFLLDPHPVMPNMALTRVEAADLAAYIYSLRK